MLLLILIAGAFNIFMSLTMQTKNFLSALLFKILPFFFGVVTLVYALNQLHIIGVFIK